jgi:purine nucleosidase
MVTRVLLDTDIASDVDDCVALALILCSPEFKLEGVTVVSGDVLLRARMAMKMLRLHGQAHVPVAMGAMKPIIYRRPVYWTGEEGVGFLGPEDEALIPSPDFAPDLIARTIMANPGEIHLICIAPLTNIALAFLREPRLAQNVAHITIMGGVLRGPNGLHLGYTESNIDADPEASHIVFTSGAPITLVPLDVTTQVTINQEKAERIRAVGTPFHEAVGAQVANFYYVRTQGLTHMHDPLTVATVIQPDLVKLRSVHIDIELKGQFTLGASLMRTPTDQFPANAQVALEVDAERAETFLMERLTRP